jgi:hypothetical protein
MNDIEKQIADQDAFGWRATAATSEARLPGHVWYSRCPLVQHIRYVNGHHLPFHELFKMRAGYVWEAEAKLRLGVLFRAGSERELVAGFDARYRGHADGEVLVDGEVMLLEIKSLPDFVFAQLVRDGGISKRNFWQVQAYLRHGNYRRGVLRFICREDGRTRNVVIERNDDVGQRLTTGRGADNGAIDADAALLVRMWR